MNPSKNYRKNGYIRSTKGSSYPTNLLLFDTESNINQVSLMSDYLPLRLGVAIHIRLSNTGEIKHRAVYAFYTIDEFFIILERCCVQRTPLNVFAHNMRFDVRVLNLPDEISKRGGHSQYPIMNERLFIWETKYKSFTVNFIDTANFGVQSVSKLGEDLGFKKLSVDFETVSDKDLLIYCQRDVEIIEKFMLEYINFLRVNDLGSFCSTLASQAFRAWRQRFMSHSVYIHNQLDAINLERTGYTGGRVECFYIGTVSGETLYYIDVNSMYPFVMSGYKYPVRLIAYTKAPRKNALINSVNQRYTIARVMVRTDRPAYPYNLNDKLVFPIGTFTTVLHQKELEYAVKHNHILRCFELASYEPSEIFSEYVAFFYAIKQKATLEHNASWRYIAKLFGNSLYGKFGQQGITRIPIGKTDEKLVERITYYSEISDRYFQEVNWFGDVIREERGGESTYSSPAVSGAVTAYARMYLWNFIEIAGQENVFYCDTDSLIVNEAGHDRLKSYLSETELGKLKLEKQSDRVTIHNAKDYEIGDEKKTKGVPKNAKLINKNVWLYLQFEGFYTWINNGAKGAPHTSYRLKSRKSTYDKGVISPDGKVTPIVLNESPDD